MKKYLLLVDILPFWSGMSRGKIIAAQKSNSLGYERGCSVLLEFWKAGRRVRSRSGPEVKIWGGEGRQFCGNEKAPTGDGWG